MSENEDDSLKLAKAIAEIIDRLKWDGPTAFTLTFIAERPYLGTIEIMDSVLTMEPLPAPPTPSDPPTPAKPNTPLQ